MKIKRIGKKLIICIFLFLIIFNFVVAPIVHINVSYAFSLTEAIGNALTGLAGALVQVLKSLFLGIPESIQKVEYNLFSSAGLTDSATITDAEELSIYHIFFNEFALTNINIFQTSDVETDGLVYNIRTFVAATYYVLWCIAVATLLVMLILIGIKSAIATLAEDKARWKQSFVDWVVSAVLVLFMSLIVVAVININNTFVDVLKPLADNSGSSEFMESLKETAMSDDVGFPMSIACILIYFLLVIAVAYFGILYIIRFLLVSLMVIISPIMPLAYSLEKSKGGRSQVLNTWFKEFCYNVFIQLIDCLVYVAIIAVPMAALESATAGWESLGSALLVVIAIFSIKPLENLLKNIFGFNKSSLLNSSQTILNNTTKVVSTGAKMAAPAVARATGAVASAAGTVASTSIKFGHDVIRNNTALGGIEDKVVDTAVSFKDSATDVIEGIRTGRYSKYYNEDENVTNDEEKARENLDNAVESSQNNESIEETISDISTNEQETLANNEQKNSEVTETNEAEKMENREKFKEEYEERLKELIENKPAVLELANKLNEIGNTNVRINLEEKIKSLIKNEGMDSAKNYVNSLGNTPEGIYAGEYLKYINKSMEMSNLINSAESDDIITQEEAKMLRENVMATLFEDNMENSQAKDSQALPDFQANEKPALEISDSVLQQIEVPTRRNVKILEIVEGDIQIDGKVNITNMREFNSKILRELEKGKYSSAKLSELQKDVLNEGDEAVKRMNNFINNQSEESAKALQTKSEKRFAAYMVESQQAGMVIASANMEVKSNNSRFSSVNSSVKQGATENTQGVLNNLNNTRRNVQQG